MDSTPPDHGLSEVQVRLREGETSTQPHIPGEYPHPELVGLISYRHLVALSIVLALLALHLQLNRDWPGYYRGISRVSGGDGVYDEEDSWRCAENLPWTILPKALEGLPSPHTARISFNIPVSASSISFIAIDRTGSYGSFRISQTGEPGSNAVAGIEARYRSQETIDNVRVCRLQKRRYDMNGEDPWRYGIMSSKPAAEKLEINIHLQLPTPLQSDSLLVISDLSTSLPLYSHHFEGLSDSVQFHNLYLGPSEGDIIMEPAILGNNLNIHSTAGSIRGIFNVSESLYVSTHGGAIELRANLIDGRAPDKDYVQLAGIKPSEHTLPTRLIMRTGTGPIDAQVAICDTAPRNNSASQADPRFKVKASTADAPINLTFVDASSTSDYALSVNAEVHVIPEGLPWWWRTPPDSSAPITVKLHETYEGSLKLETSKRVRPSVEWGRNEDGSPSGEDPSGRRQERHIEVQSGRGRAEGKVWWGPGKNSSDWTSGHWEPSHVLLKATTSDIRLIL